MNTLISIFATIMIVDSLFTLLNLSKVESVVKVFFPEMNIKKLAMVEGLVGIIIILIKFSTNTLK